MPYLPRVSHVSPHMPQIPTMTIIRAWATWLIRGGITQRCDHGITRKSHARQFSRNRCRVERGSYLVEVTGSKWRLLEGCHVHHHVHQPHRPRNYREDPVGRNCRLPRRSRLVVPLGVVHYSLSLPSPSEGT